MTKTGKMPSDKRVLVVAGVIVIAADFFYTNAYEISIAVSALLLYAP
jgi:hypothetical protein